MLILFDIDGTLLLTQGKGIQAMLRAGADVFGDPFDAQVDSAGRLDPLIMADMVAAAGVMGDAEAMLAFRRAYHRRLEEVLTPGVSEALPGVSDLLGALDGEDAVLGLVTGNLPETGLLKLERAGITTERFTIRAWADDSPHDPPARDHLPAVALARYRDAYDREADPARTVIIGDTPHDVQCAHANGLRCLGVATGKFGVDDLHRAGADHVMADLTPTAEILQWLSTP